MKHPFALKPDALAPFEELEPNRSADHPPRIINPDQWRDVFGTAAPAGLFEPESEAA